jgi:hypothetical protein
VVAIIDSHVVGFRIQNVDAVIALMMAAVRTSETLVNLYQSTRRYHPEDGHLLKILKMQVQFVCGELFIISVGMQAR